MLKLLFLCCFLMVSNFVNAEPTTLGAGDMLRISVYGNPDMTTETRISDSGEINFPLIGTVKTEGFTVSEAESKIEDKLESMGFLRKPQVNIVVLEFNSSMISVLGHVNQPGKYSATSNIKKLSDFIALAGGLTDDASDEITIMSQNKSGDATVISISIDDLFSSRGAKNNISLNKGDIIYVPKAPVFYIYGQVNNPGQYRLERNMNIAQAIAIGGGVNLQADEKDVHIKRQNKTNDEMEVIDADVSTIVQENDVVYVDESLF